MDQSGIEESEHQTGRDPSAKEYTKLDGKEKVSDSKGVVVSEEEIREGEPHGIKEYTGALGDFRHQFKNVLPEYVSGPDTFTSIKTVQQRPWSVFLGPRSEEIPVKNPRVVEGKLWSRKDNYCIN